MLKKVKRSSQGHNLCTHCSTEVIDASCQSFDEIRPVVQKKILEGFLPYMDMAAILVM